MSNRAREGSKRTPTPYRKAPRANRVKFRAIRNTALSADRVNVDPKKRRLTRSQKHPKITPELLSYKYPRNANYQRHATPPPVHRTQ